MTYSALAIGYIYCIYNTLLAEYQDLILLQFITRHYFKILFKDKSNLPVLHFSILYHLVIISDFVLFLAFHCNICTPINRFKNEEAYNCTNIRRNIIVYRFIVALRFPISNDEDKENNLSRLHTHILCIICLTQWRRNISIM